MKRGAQAVSYQYDAASNRTRLTWPGGWYASYTYDAMNRMDEVRSSEGNLLLANYDYTPLSRRSLDTLGDGGSVSYGYTLAGDGGDPRRRRLGLAAPGPSGLGDRPHQRGRDRRQRDHL
jgi:hypothetical protein